MSTGKRLAKRSILGTRVCAPTEEGIYMPGLIQATKTDARNENIYTVSFLHNKGMTGEYRGEQMIGPGFRSVVGGPIKTGQKVYVTLNGREVCGIVDQHYHQHEQVLISVHSGGQLIQLVKKMDEVRFLESRKSARLQDVDLDYSRLAEGANIKNPSVQSALSIEVPSLGSYNHSRKRRTSISDTSDSRSDTMDDCMAAMVLMRLSCSPKSPRLPGSDSVASSLSWNSTPSSSGCSSYDSPTGVSATPSSSLSSSGGYFDLGLARRTPKRTEYRCTWRGCGAQFVSCDTARRHIRYAHLDSNDAMANEDEELYYTEVEVEEDDRLGDDMSFSGESTDDASSRPSSPITPQPPYQNNQLSVIQAPHSQSLPTPSQMSNIFMSSAPTLSHLDMVRPPHEDPELQRKKFSSSPINIPLHYRHSQQKKLTTKMHMSPKHRNRGRSESRKCRKVYGMDNREQWCTQCKWKKACTRFTD